MRIDMLSRKILLPVTVAFQEGSMLKVPNKDKHSSAMIGRRAEPLRYHGKEKETHELGRNPFNQNFRKFRSKTEWIGSVQPEKFRKKWSTFRGGPLFSVGPVRSKWTVPFDHSDPFSIPGPRCSVSSVYKMEENTYHCTFMYRCYSYIHVQLPNSTKNL